MSVQTLTTNETYTDESTSTLSFPNSSETEITYNTNPSIITSEVNSNSTLVFPSEDGSNSTPMFESSETNILELNNIKLSENRIKWEKYTTNKFIMRPYVFPILDRVVYDYYNKSIYDSDNGIINRQWWTFYEHEFVGDAIIVIERKNGNPDGVWFISKEDLFTKLDKYNIKREKIFTNKNSKDTLKDRVKKYIEIREYFDKNVYVPYDIQDEINYSKLHLLNMLVIS